MPKYFRNRAEMLFAEACATFLLIQSMPHCARIEKLQRKAQERSARRWQLAFGAK